MKEETTEHAQIIVKSYSDMFEQDIEETLWAFVLDKENRLYQIDSIPFYTSLIASNDIIFADIDPAEMTAVETAFVNHVNQFKPEILKDIKEKRDLSKETEEKLKEAITHFLSNR